MQSKHVDPRLEGHSADNSDAQDIGRLPPPVRSAVRTALANEGNVPDTDVEALHYLVNCYHGYKSAYEQLAERCGRLEAEAEARHTMVAEALKREAIVEPDDLRALDRLVNCYHGYKNSYEAVSRKLVTLPVPTPSEHPSHHLAAQCRDAIAGMHDLVRACQWDAARAKALDAGVIAERLGNRAFLDVAARSLERLEDFGNAWRFYRALARIDWLAGGTEWDGGDLSGRTLLVRSMRCNVGTLVRYARLLGHAASRSGARKVIVLTAPDLIPLFRRNFPDIDFRAEGVDDAAALAEADVIACFETLCAHFAKDWDGVVQSYLPLRADPALVAEFRQRYANGNARRLIGLGWASINAVKDTPPLEHWASLIREVPSTFVSLQYGEPVKAASELQAVADGRLIVDSRVDPMGDRAVFAAQIAALDAVISVPQTCAHFAGALQVPVAVVLSEGFVPIRWPQIGSVYPWYPNTVLARRHGGSWAAAFRTVQDQLARWGLTDATSHRS